MYKQNKSVSAGGLLCLSLLHPLKQTRNSPIYIVHFGYEGGSFKCTVQANKSNRNVTGPRFSACSVERDGLEEHAERHQDNSHCRELGGQFRGCNRRKPVEYQVSSKNASQQCKKVVWEQNLHC